MFLYTTSIGAFLFDDAGKMARHAMFADMAATHTLLTANKWCPEEKKLLPKEGKTLFLGFKEEKIPGVTCTQDPAKLAIAERALALHAAKMRTALLAIARKVVRESVGEDELVTQAISTVDELDKSLSMLTKRLREWYGLKNPEAAARISDHERFVAEVLDGRATSEMGATLSADDLQEISGLAGTILALLEQRKSHELYLTEKMKTVCPNVLVVAGPTVGARLLTAAGSLKRLALMPATTLQLLGAERAMFNFLRHKAKKMPRFGILHEHKFIGRAKERNKGQAARLLADKIAIAARVDYFKGKFIGDTLLADVERRLR
jgi:nucleolar protein 56